MATVDKYKIQIEVDGEQKIIDVQDEVDNLGRKVTNFAKIGAAAFGALAVSAARMADQIVDMSEAFGMSAGKLYQMSVAAEAAGGAFDDIQSIMVRFADSVNGAVQGNDKLRDSFAQLGISRDELATLDDEQLFQAVVSGLGNMEDGAQKTALAIDLLGKRAASLNLREFARLTAAPGDANIDKLFINAADAVGKLEVAFRNLQLAALQAIAPILEVVADFDFTVQDAQKTIQVTGALIAAAFAPAIINSIIATVRAMTALAAIIRTAAAAQTVLTALIPGVGTATALAAIGLGTAAYLSLGSAMEDAAKAAEDVNDAVPSANNVPLPPTVVAAADDPIRDLQLTQSERLAEAAKRTTDQMRFQNEQANSLRRTINDVANLEENLAAKIIANNEAYVDRQNALFDLEQQIQAERDKGEQTNLAVIAQLEEQKNIVIEQYNETEKLNQAEFERLNIQRLRNELLADELSAINRVFDGTERATRANLIGLQAAGLSTEQLIKEREQGIELQQNERRNQELNARLQNATQQEDIDNIIRLKAEEEARFTAAINGIDAEARARKELRNSEIAGVVSAMEQINQQFTPFQMAQDAVLSTFNNIGSAIDQVAKGGKASFSDMARSIIADLGAMIAKAMVFNALKATFAAFGFSIPGLATGGPAQAGKPYIVGEKGPELFVPKQAGTVIPNNKLASQPTASPVQQQPTQITNNVYNISAVDAKSVAQLFYENRRAMLGTINVAQKELPYGAMG